VQAADVIHWATEIGLIAAAAAAWTLPDQGLKLLCQCRPPMQSTWPQELAALLLLLLLPGR
jgi:hypothetical protein